MSNQDSQFTNPRARDKYSSCGQKNPRFFFRKRGGVAEEEVPGVQSRPGDRFGVLMADITTNRVALTGALLLIQGMPDTRTRSGGRHKGVRSWSSLPPVSR